MSMITLHHTSGRTPSGNVSTHGTSGAEPSRYPGTSGVESSGWLLWARVTSDVETSCRHVRCWRWIVVAPLTGTVVPQHGCSSRTSQGQEYNPSVRCSSRQHDLLTSDKFGVTLFSPRRQSKFEIRIFATREGHTGFRLGFIVCFF